MADSCQVAAKPTLSLAKLLYYPHTYIRVYKCVYIRLLSVCVVPPYLFELNALITIANAYKYNALAKTEVKIIEQAYAAKVHIYSFVEKQQKTHDRQSEKSSQMRVHLAPTAPTRRQQR